jgi:hypothetical protein
MRVSSRYLHAWQMHWQGSTAPPPHPPLRPTDRIALLLLLPVTVRSPAKLAGPRTCPVPAPSAGGPGAGTVRAAPPGPPRPPPAGAVGGWRLQLAVVGAIHKCHSFRTNQTDPENRFASVSWWGKPCRTGSGGAPCRTGSDSSRGAGRAVQHPISGSPHGPCVRGCSPPHTHSGSNSSRGAGRAVQHPTPGLTGAAAAARQSPGTPPPALSPAACPAAAAT